MKEEGERTSAKGTEEKNAVNSPEVLDFLQDEVITSLVGKKGEIGERRRGRSSIIKTEKKAVFSFLLRDGGGKEGKKVLGKRRR